MKITVARKPVEPEFLPVTVTLLVESAEELKVLEDLGFHTLTVPSALYGEKGSIPDERRRSVLKGVLCRLHETIANFMENR
jgi:hypothetical protein